METSIIIPTINRMHRLKRAINSALAQTVPCEIIVFDSGSTDGTEDLCRQYGDKIFYQRVRKDPGQIAAWACAVGMARGELVHFCMDDDWMDPEFIEQTTNMFNDNTGSVLTQGIIHFEDGTIKLNLDSQPTKYYSSESIEYAMMSMELTFTPSCWIARKKDIIDNIFPGQLPFTDHKCDIGNECYMILGTLRNHPAVGYINEPLVHLGAEADSLTIAALSNGGEKTARFVNEYTQVKASYMRTKEAYDYTHSVSV